MSQEPNFIIFPLYVPTPLIEKTILLLLCILDFLVKNQLITDVWIFF